MINPTSTSHMGIRFGPTHRAHRGWVDYYTNLFGYCTVSDSKPGNCRVSDRMVGKCTVSDRIIETAAAGTRKRT